MGEDANSFRVDEAGNIFPNWKFDREVRALYELVAVAEDSGQNTL